jgi:hypothetical protein
LFSLSLRSSRSLATVKLADLGSPRNPTCPVRPSLTPERRAPLPLNSGTMGRARWLLPLPVGGERVGERCFHSGGDGPPLPAHSLRRVTAAGAPVCDRLGMFLPRGAGGKPALRLRGRVGERRLLEEFHRSSSGNGTRANSGRRDWRSLLRFRLFHDSKSRGRLRLTAEMGSASNASHLTNGRPTSCTQPNPGR